MSSAIAQLPPNPTSLASQGAVSPVCHTFLQLVDFVEFWCIYTDERGRFSRAPTGSWSVALRTVEQQSTAMGFEWRISWRKGLNGQSGVRNFSLLGPGPSNQLKKKVGQMYLEMETCVHGIEKNLGWGSSLKEAANPVSADISEC